jgi:hypothetical protein
MMLSACFVSNMPIPIPIILLFSMIAIYTLLGQAMQYATFTVSVQYGNTYFLLDLICSLFWQSCRFHLLFYFCVAFSLSLFLSFLLSFFLSSPSSKGKLDKAIEVFSTLLLYRTDLPAAHLGTGEHSTRLCHAAQHYLRRLRAFPLNHYYLLENHFLWSSLFLLLTRLCFLAVNNTAVT